MNRRRFIQAGCIGTMVRALGRPAQSQSGPPFKVMEIDVSGNMIFCRRSGEGSAILMAHVPRTSLMWRFLAANHSVVYIDLRAYGRSGIPVGGEDHFAYSKRATANELMEVMAKLGFSTFTLVGHDRGGRVAYRLERLDAEHDRADKETARRIECPMLHLWAEGGPLDTFYSEEGGSLGIWRQWAPLVEGQAMKGGHFFPEENPDDTAPILTRFLTA